MKRRFHSVLIGLFLFAGALGLAELFPGLRPYLPTFDTLIADLKGESSYRYEPPANQTNAKSSKHGAKKNTTQDVVLALSWTAAFCETAPHKRECKTQKAGRYDVTHFALHGLWPEGQYCSQTPYQNVSDSLWKAMKKTMPGTASGLHKHEWKKHGTCYSDTPERYYEDSLRLLNAINKTPVRTLFEANIGQHLSARAIRAAFDRSFGKGAGERVLIHCVRDEARTLIQELRIGLKGDIASANLPVLLKQARHKKQGCKGGIIDAVGHQ